MSRYVHGDLADQHFARLGIKGDLTRLRWYVTNRQNSVIALVDGINGKVEDRLLYAGFGSANFQVLRKFELPERYQYVGRELDSATLLQYDKGRWYDPGSGRWQSEDPRGFGGGDANLYRYEDNNPAQEEKTEKAVDPELARKRAQWEAEMYVLNNAGRLFFEESYEYVKHEFGQYGLKSVDAAAYGGQLIFGLLGVDLEYTPYSEQGQAIAANIQGYRAAGVSKPAATIFAAISETPILSAGLDLAEIIEGRSLRGQDFGRPFTEWDYALRTAGVVLEVVPLTIGLAIEVKGGISAARGAVAAERAALRAAEQAPIRQRVLANIAESRAARQASKFRGFAEEVGSGQGKFRGQPHAFGTGSRDQRVVALMAEAEKATGVQLTSLVDEVRYAQGSSGFFVENGKRIIEIGSDAFGKTRMGQLIEAAHEIGHAQKFEKMVKRKGFSLAETDYFGPHREYGSPLYAREEQVVERLARWRVRNYSGGVTPQQEAASTKYIQWWKGVETGQINPFLP